eukprot:3210545-Rhodomonas_salina.5
MSPGQPQGGAQKEKKRKLNSGEAAKDQDTDKDKGYVSGASTRPPKGAETSQEQATRSIADEQGGWYPKSVYTKLPSSLSRVLDDSSENFSERAADFDLEDFLEGRLGKFGHGQYQSRLEDKALILGKTESLWKTNRKRRQSQKKPTERKKAQRGIKLQSSEDAYEKLMPLNTCWTAYIRDLMGARPQSKKSASDVFAKCDLHGAIAVVARATCPTSIGLRGIVARETANSVVLCGTDGRFRTIVKKGTEFTVTVGRLLFTLSGDHLISRWDKL